MSVNVYVSFFWKATDVVGLLCGALNPRGTQDEASVVIHLTGQVDELNFLLVVIL